MVSDAADTPELVPFLARMSPDLHDQLAERAEQEERSMAAVMRRALRDYLKKAVR